MSSIDPLKLNSLLEVGRRGSMAAAARSLHITPAAVSQHIRSLETSLGVQVLHRSPTGAALTDVGRALAHHAATIETALEAAKNHVTDSLGATTFTIGFFPSLAGPIAMAIGDAHNSDSLSVRFAAIETAAEVAAIAVRNRDLDAAFAIDWPDNPQPRLDGVEYHHVFDEPLEIAHSMESRPRNLADFGNANWIVALDDTGCGRSTRNACRRSGFEPRITHQTNDFAAAAALAAIPDSATVVPSQLGPAMPPGVKSVATSELHRQVLLVARTDCHPALLELVTDLRRRLC